MLIRAVSALHMQSRSVPASGAIPAPIYAAKTKETTFAPTTFAQLTPPAVVVFTETERDKVKDAPKKIFQSARCRSAPNRQSAAAEAQVVYRSTTVTCHVTSFSFSFPILISLPSSSKAHIMVSQSSYQASRVCKGMNISPGAT